MSRVSFFSITVISPVKNMSNESQITLPLSVENQIDTFFKKDEFEAYQELSNIFKQAVLQKANAPIRRMENDQTAISIIGLMGNDQFTLSKITTLLNLDKTHRSKQYNTILAHTKIYGWSNEIIESSKGIRGGDNKSPCEIFFTPFGFLQCFQVFPRKKLSQSVVNICFKIAGWVMITNAVHHAQLITQNKQLIKEVDAGCELIEDLTQDLDQAHIDIQDTTSDLVAREESPWKEFCAMKGLPEDYKRWGRRKNALFRLFHTARDAGHIAKRNGTCWYYVSEAGRTSAMNSWE